ncbi:hypothetical protein [Devriesea agamarum]|nr:hypothetical protein [Devriesea agamarum]
MAGSAGDLSSGVDARGVSVDDFVSGADDLASGVVDLGCDACSAR